MLQAFFVALTLLPIWQVTLASEVAQVLDGGAGGGTCMRISPTVTPC